MQTDIPAKLSRTLPQKPGVYLFRDKNGTVLYVGKAVNLKNRVRSYFISKSPPPKIKRLVRQIYDIDFFITDSDQEALILENSLIKKHSPYYNVRLKDDKTYPCLKITLSDNWPRIHITRRPQDDGSRYFGPFAIAGSLRKTMSLINKLFPYRTCKKAITGDDARPCLKYHINRCAGPCIGATNQTEYRQIISQVILFLEGKYGRVISKLQKQMEKESANLQFEKAALLRDQITAIKSISQQQKVVSPKKTDEDLIAIAQDKNEACAQVFFIRNGKIMGKDHFILDGVQDEPPEQIMSSFIKQFYSTGASIPPKVFAWIEPSEGPLIKDWLYKKRGRKVKLATPKRGEKKKLLNMVAENASEALEQFKIKRLADSGKTAAALEELKNKLHLPGLPHRIECYDISNIGGTAAVGSMVVFGEGVPQKTAYRRFKIRAIEGINDYAMMQEMIWRRFGRGTKKQKVSDSNWDQKPDLILIDGGLGHLNAIIEVTQSIGFDDIPLASIAKQNEEIFLPNVESPVTLSKNSEALYLLQRIRDEAHRFAVSYHIKTRSKASLKSQLDEVPGIGPKRKKALLKKFDSVKGIKEAAFEDLCTVAGMNPAIAQKLKEYL